MARDKAQHEQRVLHEFLLRVSLNVAPAKVESRDPPEPDILCSGPDGNQYFELGRLLDNEMQRSRLQAIRLAPQPVSARDYDVRLPEREILKQKIARAKGYRTDGLPLDLLLYYDWDRDKWLAHDVPVAPDLASHYSIVMKPILKAQNSYRRAYVFERRTGTVLYRYPEI